MTVYTDTKGKWNERNGNNEKVSKQEPIKFLLLLSCIYFFMYNFVVYIATPFYAMHFYLPYILL